MNSYLFMALFFKGMLATNFATNEVLKLFYIQVTCNFQYQYLLTKKECQSILDYCVDLKAFVKEKSSSNSFQTLRLNEVSGI